MSSTANNVAPATMIPQLPLDVWKLIADHLEGLDLKNLRRVSKSLAEVCANHLFREISLIPWTSCLQDFTALLESTTLGTHVHKITYDDRWHRRFWDLCRAMKPVDEGAVQNIFDQYHDLESVSATPEAEVALLANVFSLLPQLIEVEIIENTQHPQDDHPPHWFTCFMRKICKGQDGDESVVINRENCDSCRFERSTSLTVIGALPQQSPSIRTLNIRGLNCMRDSLFSPAASPSSITPAASLSSLQTLALIFTMPEAAIFTECYRESSSLPLPHTLASFLTSATNLTHLSIRGESIYGDPGTHCDGRELLIKCLAHSNTVFPNLHTVSIQDTPIHGFSLLAFLSRHNGILKHLTLRNLILTSDRHPSSPSSPPLCLTSLLHTLRSLSLLSFSTGGLLASTTSEQSWKFPDPKATTTYNFQSPSSLAAFIRSQNMDYYLSMRMWACGNPGYGNPVEGNRYPCLHTGRWFDGHAVNAIENWVLARGEAGVGGMECPMQKFRVGGEDAVRREEELWILPGWRGSGWVGWRVWVWWDGSAEEAEERIGARNGIGNRNGSGSGGNGDESGSRARRVKEGVERVRAGRWTSRWGWEFKSGSRARRTEERVEGVGAVTLTPRWGWEFKGEQVDSAKR